jgi:hypothetical protein
VEVQRLIDSLVVDPTSGDLLVTESGVGTVESVIFAKYLMFRYVYWHHTARIAGAMINRAVLDCLLALGVADLTVADPRLRRLCLATDATLEPTLRSLVQEAGVAPPAGLSLLQRVNQRRLFKRAQVVPCAQHPDIDRDLRDAHLRRQREELLATQANAALPPGAAPLAGSDVLIDLPPLAKFAADIRGIVIDGEDGAPEVVSWDDAPRASYLTGATVAAMEQSIRTALLVYDAHRPDADALRATLRSFAILPPAGTGAGTD